MGAVLVDRKIAVSSLRPGDGNEMIAACATGGERFFRDVISLTFQARSRGCRNFPCSSPNAADFGPNERSDGGGRPHLSDLDHVDRMRVLGACRPAITFPVVLAATDEARANLEMVS
jgi:hypothetical protein